MEQDIMAGKRMLELVDEAIAHLNNDSVLSAKSSMWLLHGYICGYYNIHVDCEEV